VTTSTVSPTLATAGLLVFTLQAKFTYNAKQMTLPFTSTKFYSDQNKFQPMPMQEILH